MKKYLESTEYIHWTEPDILAQAKILAEGIAQPEDIARKYFEFVCDEIKHSWNYKLNPVTCKASDVLKHGTGYCYAKSHLLAALLRANKIPAGLAYVEYKTGALKIRGAGAKQVQYAPDRFYVSGHATIFPLQFVSTARQCELAVLFKNTNK